MLCWESTNIDKQGQGKELEVIDLNVNSLGFYSDQVYPMGALLYIEINLPGRKKPLSSTIQVVRIETTPVKNKHIIGSIFTDVSHDNQRAIAAVIDKKNIYQLLGTVLNQGASDLHLAVGCPPIIRNGGILSPLSEEIIENGQVEAMLYPLLTSQQIKSFEQHREIDFAFSPNLASRFRVNMHWQKGFVEAAFRSIPVSIQSFEALGFSETTMDKFCCEKSGLVLTMSAMINHINNEKESVIIAIENPIEYIFRNNKSVIKQRELGSDTLSYAEALKRALRQDPDVICVSEILDTECLMAALRAAETGHLVISTIHAPSAIQAIERMVNLFPPEHVSSICQQLSSNLVGIVYQTLLPGGNNTRVMASEILINNNAMKFLIRERKYSQMSSVLQTGQAQGMHTMEKSIEQLKAKGLINIKTTSSIFTTE
jgi:twitching motility protein PilT